MAYVVTENCIKCKYTECVEYCPVDCFHEGPNFLVIDPEECINCSLCVKSCDANAIFSEEDVPDDQKQFIELNKTLSTKWPILTLTKSPPDDADKWNGIKNKIKYLKNEDIDRRTKT